MRILAGLVLVLLVLSLASGQTNVLSGSSSTVYVYSKTCSPSPCEPAATCSIVGGLAYCQCAFSNQTGPLCYQTTANDGALASLAYYAFNFPSVGPLIDATLLTIPAGLYGNGALSISYADANNTLSGIAFTGPGTTKTPAGYTVFNVAPNDAGSSFITQTLNNTSLLSFNMSYVNLSRIDQFISTPNVQTVVLTNVIFSSPQGLLNIINSPSITYLDLENIVFMDGGGVNIETLISSTYVNLTLWTLVNVPVTGNFPQKFASASMTDVFVSQDTSTSPQRLFSGQFGPVYKASNTLVFSNLGVSGPIPMGVMCYTPTITLLNMNGLNGSFPSFNSSCVTNSVNLFNLTGVSGPLPSSWANSPLDGIFCSSVNTSGALPGSWLFNVTKVAVNNCGLSSFDVSSISVDSILTTLQVYNEPNLVGTIPTEFGLPVNITVVGIANITQLSGTLPTQWFKIHNLSLENLPNVVGTLPVEWSSTTNLTSISLTSLGVTGTLPQQWNNITIDVFSNVRLRSLHGLNGSFPAWNKVGAYDTTWSFGNIPLSGLELNDLPGVSGPLPIELFESEYRTFLSIISCPGVIGPLPNSTTSNSSSIGTLTLQNLTNFNASFPSSYGPMLDTTWFVLKDLPLLTGMLPAEWGSSGSNMILTLIRLPNLTPQPVPSGYTRSLSSLIIIDTPITGDFNANLQYSTNFFGYLILVNTSMVLTTRANLTPQVSGMTVPFCPEGSDCLISISYGVTVSPSALPYPSYGNAVAISQDYCDDVTGFCYPSNRADFNRLQILNSANSSESHPCLSDPCGLGICEVTSVSPFYECICPDGSSPPCDNINPCAEETTPCLNGGVCNGLGALKLCFCDFAFTGESCELVSNSSCSSLDCGAHGTCVSGSGMAYCKCDSAWKGSNCDIPVRVNPMTCVNTVSQSYGFTAVTQNYPTPVPGVSTMCECDSGVMGLTCGYQDCPDIDDYGIHCSFDNPCFGASTFTQMPVSWKGCVLEGTPANPSAAMADIPRGIPYVGIEDLYRARVFVNYMAFVFSTITNCTTAVSVSGYVPGCVAAKSMITEAANALSANYMALGYMTPTGSLNNIPNFVQVPSTFFSVSFSCDDIQALWTLDGICCSNTTGIVTVAGFTFACQDLYTSARIINCPAPGLAALTYPAGNTSVTPQIFSTANITLDNDSCVYCSYTAGFMYYEALSGSPLYNSTNVANLNAGCPCLTTNGIGPVLTSIFSTLTVSSGGKGGLVRQ